MAIVLNGTTGITAPDLDVTAQSSDITTTGDISAVDATLSGGIYLGGTGSANKLDDYEEGTFTFTATNTVNLDSVSLSNAYYRKTGSVVHLEFYATVNPTSSGSTIKFDLTVPFTAQNAYAAGSIVIGSANAGHAFFPNTTACRCICPSGSVTTNGNTSHRFSITYFTA